MNNFFKNPAPPPAGPVQQDGNVVVQQARPTKAPLSDRRASPPEHNTSGIERAMAAHADKVHRVSPRPTRAPPRR